MQMTSDMLHEMQVICWTLGVLHETQITSGMLHVWCVDKSEHSDIHHI
jgi:hypothetical protein